MQEGKKKKKKNVGKVHSCCLSLAAPSHWRPGETTEGARVLYLLHQPWSVSHVLGHRHAWQQKILFWSSLSLNSGHTFKRGVAPLRNHKFAKGSPFDIDNCLLVSNSIAEIMLTELFFPQEHFSVPLYGEHHPPIRGSPWDTTIQLCPADLLVVLYTWLSCLFWKLKILVSNKIWWKLNIMFHKSTLCYYLFLSLQQFTCPVKKYHESD